MKVKGNLIIDGNLVADNVSGSAITFTDGTNSHSNNNLNFSNSDFYLSTNLSGQPVVNDVRSKYTDDFKIIINPPTNSNTVTATIPSNTSTVIKVFYHLRSSAAVNFDTLRIRLNGNSTSYDRNRTTFQDNGQVTIFQATGSEMIAGEICGASSENSNSFSTGKVVFSGHSSSTWTTDIGVSSGIADLGGGGPPAGQKYRTVITHNVFEVITTVTSMEFFFTTGNFVDGSKIIVVGY